ncbi:MAG: DUF2752 domain-containing protein [Blastocatellia bacterium]|nr:DUF2752 domain-containing protein [Blastocatellia bacterium]
MNPSPEQDKDAATATSAERIIAGGGALAVTAGAIVVWAVDPANSSLLPKCPLIAATGFACPGCGLTRGFHALFHGDIYTALDFNALIPLFILLFGFFYITMGWVAVTGKVFPRWSISLPFIWGMLVMMLLFGFLRNLPFHPFTFLYP